MSAESIDFKQRSGALPHHRTKDTAQNKSNQEIFADCVEEIQGLWQVYAVKNKLNNFIGTRIPSFAQGPRGCDYVNDLNVISNVEQKLGMLVSMFYPATAHPDQIGWMAAFHRGRELFTTPASMASEPTARALNILLYLDFNIQMKGLGREVLT
jgi:hypothetical protein